MSLVNNNLISLPSLTEIIDRSPLTVRPDLSVAAALALMSQAQGSHCKLIAAGNVALAEPNYLQPHSCVLVTESGELRGILTERDIVRMTAQQQDLTTTCVGEVMTRQLVTLTQSPAQSVLTVLPLFHQHRIRHLPIVDELGHLVGMVTPDLLRQILQPANLLKLRSIEEVMTRSVIHAPANASTLDIAGQMATHHVSCVVVTAATPGESMTLQPLGIITERDIVQFQTLGIDLDRTLASTVMSSPVFCLQPAESLWRAQQEMNARQIGRIVVTDLEGQMLGIVTQTSLLQPLEPIEVLGMVDILQQQVQLQTAALEQTNRELREASERQQQAEDELRRANDRLAQIVAERTGALSQCDTQHQQVEGALQSTLKLLEFQKYALDRAAIVAITDRAGVITYVNDQFCQISQYTSSELVGQTHQIINSGYHPPEFFQTLWQTITRGEVWRGEICNRAKDGSLYWVATTIVPYVDDLGIPFQYLTIRFDITTRKSTENALRQSERKFRAIFDGTFQFVGLLDTNGILLEGNRTALNAIGVTSEEVIGQLFWETPWWTHSPALQLQLKQAIVQAATGQLVRFEARHFLADGSYITVDFSLSPIFDETGKVIMLIPEGRDISARKAAELQIREQATLLDISTDAIFVCDLDDRIRFWNKGAERIYGWSASEALQRDVNSLLYLDPSPFATTALASVLQHGEWQGELKKVTKKGQIVIAQSRWTLVRDEDGNPKEILIVDTDITDKKQLEAQFLRAQRLESLGTLASGIAHDMNNILTPILAAAQLLPLRLKNLDDRTKSLLQMLEESAKRGTHLVGQILSFARGSDGARASVQIRHILSEVVRVARQTFPKSIEISLNLETVDLWPISGDATQLQQVLMNLMVNARDAMPDGGTLNIAAENLILDENYLRMNIDARVSPYVMLTISDTGTGIPPEILDRIFEPFFTTKEPGKGTGLGLSTTLGIVKSHGGFVNTYSDLGKGTCFKIYLPAEATAETEIAIETQELPLGNGELVLVADDEISVRAIIKASLEAYNYRVITANDGIEAISIYAQRQAEIKVVLLDLMMPVLDSASTIRTLQRIDPDISIVVMSGLIANEPNMSDVNVQAFLAKPFTSQALLQILHRIQTTLPSRVN
jgi:PAS domain S-box-containing protein